MTTYAVSGCANVHLFMTPYTLAMESTIQAGPGEIVWVKRCTVATLAQRRTLPDRRMMMASLTHNVPGTVEVRCNAVVVDHRQQRVDYLFVRHPGRLIFLLQTANPHRIRYISTNK